MIPLLHFTTHVVVFVNTFITLIPKMCGAKELKEFRPISLIEGVYQIISKLITERLKTVMGERVDEHQATK